jgi:hypothetical protein
MPDKVSMPDKKIHECSKHKPSRGVPWEQSARGGATWNGAGRDSGRDLNKDDLDR